MIPHIESSSNGLTLVVHEDHKVANIKVDEKINRKLKIILPCSSIPVIEIEFYRNFLPALLN